MNVKKGYCIDCPPGSTQKPLISKRCQSHYWQHRHKVNSKKPAALSKKERSKKLDVYFANQILTIPDKCENCGCKLVFSQSWMKRAAICHILPKAIFKSVETHPQNRWFGCLDCHTNFDNRGKEYVVTMKVYPVVLQRAAVLLPLLGKEERRRVPEYLEP